MDPVARGQVVRDCVAGHMVKSLRRVDGVAIAPEDDRQFSFEVDMRGCLRGQSQGRSGSGNGRGRLQEGGGMRGGRPRHFGEVLAVSEAGGEN